MKPDDLNESIRKFDRQNEIDHRKALQQDYPRLYSSIYRDAPPDMSEEAAERYLDLFRMMEGYRKQVVAKPASAPIRAERKLLTKDWDTEANLQQLLLDDKISLQEYEQRIDVVLRNRPDQMLPQAIDVKQQQYLSAWNIWNVKPKPWNILVKQCVFLIGLAIAVLGVCTDKPVVMVLGAAYLGAQSFLLSRVPDGERNLGQPKACSHCNSKRYLRGGGSGQQEYPCPKCNPFNKLTSSMMWKPESEIDHDGKRRVAAEESRRMKQTPGARWNTETQEWEYPPPPPRRPAAGGRVPLPTMDPVRLG